MNTKSERTADDARVDDILRAALSMSLDEAQREARRRDERAGVSDIKVQICHVAKCKGCGVTRSYIDERKAKDFLRHCR